MYRLYLPGSGGNELFDLSDEWIPATFENKNIAMLKEIVDRLDPDRLMLPTLGIRPASEALTRRVPRTTTTFTVRGNMRGVEGHYKFATTPHQASFTASSAATACRT